MKRIGLIFSLLGFFPAVAWGQRERADIRQGNKAYYEGKYPEAEVGYKRAIEKNINSYEANFNLAGALYKQERYDDAAATYEKLAQDGTDVRRQAATYYNMGNTALRQRKIDRAIEAYKRALRLVPDDREAKLNLAYAQKLKQQEEQQNQNQNQDQNNPDQNQDPNGGDGGGMVAGRITAIRTGTIGIIRTRIRRIRGITTVRRIGIVGRASRTPLSLRLRRRPGRSPSGCCARSRRARTTRKSGWMRSVPRRWGEGAVESSGEVVR